MYWFYDNFNLNYTLTEYKHWKSLKIFKVIYNLPINMIYLQHEELIINLYLYFFKYKYLYSTIFYTTYSRERRRRSHSFTLIMNSFSQITFIRI